MVLISFCNNLWHSKTYLNWCFIWFRNCSKLFCCRCRSDLSFCNLSSLSFTFRTPNLSLCKFRNDGANCILLPLISTSCKWGKQCFHTLHVLPNILEIQATLFRIPSSSFLTQTSQYKTYHTQRCQGPLDNQILSKRQGPTQLSAMVTIDRIPSSLHKLKLSSGQQHFVKRTLHGKFVLRYILDII
jgi:hypothetical protein